MYWNNRNWFNLGFDFIKIFGKNFKFYNLFNNITKCGEHFWGFGLIQLGQRHLFYIGDAGLKLFFINKNHIRV